MVMIGFIVMVRFKVKVRVKVRVRFRVRWPLPHTARNGTDLF